MPHRENQLTLDPDYRASKRIMCITVTVMLIIPIAIPSAIFSYRYVQSLQNAYVAKGITEQDLLVTDKVWFEITQLGKDPETKNDPEEEKRLREFEELFSTNTRSKDHDEKNNDGTPPENRYLGKIEVGLFGKTVPKTVKNFISLSKNSTAKNYKNSKTEEKPKTYRT